MFMWCWYFVGSTLHCGFSPRTFITMRSGSSMPDVLDWEYCHTSGTPLTDADLANFNYHVFSGLLVRIRWIDYPELKKKKRKSSK